MGAPTLAALWVAFQLPIGAPTQAPMRAPTQAPMGAPTLAALRAAFQLPIGVPTRAAMQAVMRLQTRAATPEHLRDKRWRTGKRPRSMGSTRQDLSVASKR